MAFTSVNVKSATTSLPIAIDGTEAKADRLAIALTNMRAANRVTVNRPLLTVVCFRFISVSFSDRMTMARWKKGDRHRAGRFSQGFASIELGTSPRFPATAIHCIRLDGGHKDNSRRHASSAICMRLNVTKVSHSVSRPWINISGNASAQGAYAWLFFQQLHISRRDQSDEHEDNSRVRDDNIQTGWTKLRLANLVSDTIQIQTV